MENIQTKESSEGRTTREEISAAFPESESKTFTSECHIFAFVNIVCVRFI